MEDKSDYKSYKYKPHVTYERRRQLERISSIIDSIFTGFAVLGVAIFLWVAVEYYKAFHSIEKYETDKVEMSHNLEGETFRLCDLKHIHDSHWICRIWK